MTRLSDRIEDIDLWYVRLTVDDQIQWKNPQTIAKHGPQHLLVGMGHNKPKPPSKTGKRKRASSAEEDRLRMVLIAVINEFVMPVNPQKAAELLAQFYPSYLPGPDDSLNGLGVMAPSARQTLGRERGGEG
jgi:hypothetical protein